MAHAAEILSVGTELLLGNIVNTDARELSVLLSQLGIHVYWHSVVGDNPQRLRESIAIARRRADIIITTGGLGPTCDDLTKQTIAEAFGLPLVFDPQAKADLERYFALRGHPMTENNLQQAYLPAGCTPFYNTCGTAPGCGFYADGTHVLILPGPPKECMTMMRVSGVPYLAPLCEGKLYSHNIRIFGMGEAAVESRLRERMNAMTNPTLAPYASEAEVRLRLTARAESEAEAEAMMAPVLREVCAELGDVVYGVDCDSLEQRCLQLLKEQGKTLAAAESCTGGLIAKRITDLPGASSVFNGGVTVYTNEAKMRLLGVPAEVLEQRTAVCADVARLLAERVRQILGADFGIGVTGVAGPDTDGVHPVGTVFVALAEESGCVVRPLRLSPLFDRQKIRLMAANEALDLLRRSLSGCLRRELPENS